MLLSPLPDVMIEPLVRHALLEDLGRAGDVTTDAIVPRDQTWTARITTRQSGIIAGLDFARLAFSAMNRDILFMPQHSDGTMAEAGQTLAVIKGSAHAILSGERVALNFLSHLSGIATTTHHLVQAIKPHASRIACTRKTTPLLRIAEKYAVRAGGGSNHRFGLDDAILIKDNHIDVAGGVRPAIMAARAAVGHLQKIEVEVDTLDQLRETLDLPIDAVLLDNMTNDHLREAVAMVNKRFITEASGRITVATAPAIAATGIDIISVGWITHSSPILDIGLDAA